MRNTIIFLQSTQFMLNYFKTLAMSILLPSLLLIFWTGNTLVQTIICDKKVLFELKVTCSEVSTENNPFHMLFNLLHNICSLVNRNAYVLGRSKEYKK